jgi:hypothetical protein
MLGLMEYRAGIASRITASLEWLRAGLRAEKRPDQAPAMPATSPIWPAIPQDGGDWFACRTPGEAWRLREVGQTDWHALDDRGFRVFQAQVAESGGRMETLTIEWDGPRRVEVRQRTLGHSLDGDRRDCPAILRRSEGWVDFHYYRAGNPVGHERLSRDHWGHPAGAAGGGRQDRAAA